jgi:hypothetical protein
MAGHCRNMRRLRPIRESMVGRKAFALHRPIIPILIDRGAVAPVERFAVEF